MIVNRQAEYAAKIRNEYVVVGHDSGYTVIKDELDNLYAVSDQDEIMEIGTLCEASELIPLENMKEENKIRMLFKGNEVLK